MNHPHSYVIPVATINAKCNLNSLWRPTQHSGRTKSHTAMDCLLLGTCASRCLQPATGDASCSIRPAHWVICTVLALKLFPRLCVQAGLGMGLILPAEFQSDVLRFSWLGYNQVPWPWRPVPFGEWHQSPHHSWQWCRPTRIDPTRMQVFLLSAVLKPVGTW